MLITAVDGVEQPDTYTNIEGKHKKRKKERTTNEFLRSLCRTNKAHTCATASSFLYYIWSIYGAWEHIFFLSTAGRRAFFMFTPIHNSSCYYVNVNF
jgi:hypothetical protein